MTTPLVSVLIPAFRARSTIDRCLAGFLSSQNREVPTEILVESDDASTYSSPDPRVRPANAGLVASGVGATRNRALARARGSFITYVDADDEVAPDYLPRLLLAAGPGGALARTEVVEDGHPIAQFGTAGCPLDWQQAARHGASFRGLFPRADCPPFENDLSQDILHLAEVMLRLGPLPVAETTYRLHLAPETVTRAADFSQRVDAAYLRHIDRLGHSYPDHPALDLAQDLFRAKRALNQLYQTQARPGESYYAFIARIRP